MVLRDSGSSGLTFARQVRCCAADLGLMITVLGAHPLASLGPEAQPAEATRVRVRVGARKAERVADATGTAGASV